MLKRLLGILSYVGMALVFGAVAIRVTRPEWDQYAVYAAWTGLGLVVLYTLGQWREIVAHFRRRNMRYGVIASLSVLIALAILILGNWLSYRQNKRWDLTANRQYSLSDQTVKLLQDLNAPVKFLVFDQQPNFDTFRSRLEQYRYHSPHVSIEYIDADRRPVETRQYEIQNYGTIVIEHMDRREQATSAEEQELTNKLIRVLNPEERKVYFLEGHGEKDPTDTDRSGYGGVAEALRRENYEVERLALAQQKDVPEDATVVILAGPTRDLLSEEIDALRRYLGRAGKLMVLIDPQVGPGAVALPNVLALLKEWAIELGDNVVVDLTGATNDPAVAVAVQYPSHPLTDPLGGTLTLYPLARSVEPITEGVNGRFAQPIVQTSPRSYAETDLAALAASRGVRLDEGTGDKPGPITIAAAVSAPASSEQSDPPPPDEGETGPKPETRLVVFGDSDFAVTATSGVGGNVDLFANAVNWLAQQENLISIRPREAADRRITLTATQAQGLMWVSIILIPLAVLGAGALTWWRRR